MSAIHRSGIYELDAPGAAAECVVVLTSATWARTLGDCVVVPVFRRSEAPTHELLQPAPIDHDPQLRIDASLVQTIPVEWVGQRIDTCTGTAWNRVRIAVRLHLCIDQLRAGLPSPLATHDPDDWWPRQGMVRYRTLPATGTDKLHAVVSSDRWNALAGASSVVRLTSSTKAWRSPIEVPVPGGSAIVSDLWPVPHPSLKPETPAPPRPDQLTSDQLAALATRLQVVLGLV